MVKVNNENRRLNHFFPMFPFDGSPLKTENQRFSLGRTLGKKSVNTSIECEVYIKDIRTLINIVTVSGSELTRKGSQRS